MISKISNQKYMLKQDLPGVKKGRILVDEGLFMFEEPRTKAEQQYRFNRDIIFNMKDWFQKHG